MLEKLKVLSMENQMVCLKVKQMGHQKVDLKNSLNCSIDDSGSKLDPQKVHLM